MRTPLRALFLILMILLVFSCGKKVVPREDEKVITKTVVDEIVPSEPEVQSESVTEEISSPEEKVPEEMDQQAPDERKLPEPDLIVEDTVTDVIEEALVLESALEEASIDDVLVKEVFPEVASIEKTEDKSNLQPPLTPEREEERTLEIGELAILPDDWKNFVTRSSERIDPPGDKPVVPDGEEPVLIAVVPPEEVKPEEPGIVAVTPPEEAEQPVVVTLVEPAAAPGIEQLEESVSIAVVPPEEARIISVAPPEEAEEPAVFVIVPPEEVERLLIQEEPASVAPVAPEEPVIITAGPPEEVEEQVFIAVAPPEPEEPVVMAPPEEVEEQVFIAVAPPEPEEPEEPVVIDTAPPEPGETEEPVVSAAAPTIEPVIAAEPTREADTPVVAELVEPVPEIPVILEGGPQILLTSPLPQDYYRSSLLLEGECLPGEGLGDKEGRVRSLSWKIPAMGDWSNTVFMEEDGSFQLDLVTSGLEGPQVLILESEDFAGRISSQTIELQDGNQPPRIVTEREEKERSYGAQLSLKGLLVDPYQGIRGLEGIRSLTYRMVPQDRSTGDEVLTGRIPLNNNEFFIAINMADRKGEQMLQLEALGENESRGRLEIRLFPGTGDIPSFALAPQDGRLVFSWEDIPGAIEQNIYLTDQAGVEPEDNPTVQFNKVKSPLVIDGTLNGRRYRARLEILTEQGRFWSEVQEAVPLAPGTLDLMAQGGFEQIRLSWKPISGADRFRIWRRSDTEKVFSVLVEEVPGEEYIDATATFGTKYTYRIEPALIAGPLSYEVPAASVESPSDKITLASHYRQILPQKIAVQGDYAYVAAGEGGFHIMDISIPQKPESIGYLEQGGVRDVYIGEEYVYLASGDQGFQIVNIEEPTRPFLILSRITPNAVSVAGRDNLVFVADSNMGLQIFDVTDRQSPQRMSSLRDLKISQLELKGNFLYAATGDGGMSLLDISNPYSPEIINSFDDYPVYDILVQDEMIYLACGNQGMVIMEQIGTGEWQELSHYPSSDARMIRLWEDYAMIADGRGGLKAVDISQPSDPRYFGSYSGSEVKALAMADDYALLADISGLKVVRTYLFGQSFVQQNWTTPGRAYAVVADGKRLWVADRQGGVSVYQADSPERMNQSSLLRNFATDFAEDFMIKDDILYVADGPGGVKLFRLSDASKKPVLQVPVTGRARRILPYGSQVVVISSEEGIIFMDETRESPGGTPSLSYESRFYTSDPRDALFYGSTLFVGDAEDGLVVAQKLNGQFFELERLSEYQGIKQLLIKENILYVLHNKGITLLDVRNPESLRPLAIIPTTDAEGMQLEGQLLYLAEGFKGISVYRIDGDFQPLKVSVCEDLFAVDAAPHGSSVYVADMDGISVVKIIIPDWK